MLSLKPSCKERDEFPRSDIHRSLEFTQDSSLHRITNGKTQRSESKEKTGLKDFIGKFRYRFTQSTGQVIHSTPKSVLQCAKKHLVRLYIRVTQDTQEGHWLIVAVTELQDRLDECVKDIFHATAELLAFRQPTLLLLDDWCKRRENISTVSAALDPKW